MNRISPKLFLLFMGMHLCLPLTAGGNVLIPEVIVLSLLLITGFLFKTALGRKRVPIFVCLCGLSILSILLSPDWIEHLPAHIRSLLNFIFTMLMVTALLSALNKWSKDLDMLFNIKFFICVTLLLSAMETTVPAFNEMVYTVRELLFPTNRIYDALTRDITLFGFVRPTFFGNEPSYLGITLAAFSACLALSSSDFKALTLAMLLLTAGMLLTRSLTALPIALLIPYAWTSDMFARQLRFQHVIFLAALPFLCLAGFLLTLNLFGARIELFLAGEDNSTILRLIKPVQAMLISLQDSPITGTGIGGRDKLIESMLSTTDWSGHLVNYLSTGRISDYFSTGTFLIVAETGILSLFILQLIYKLFKQLLPAMTVKDFLVCFLLITITMGGWTHPRPWLFIGLVLFFLNQRRYSMLNASQSLKAIADPERFRPKQSIKLIPANLEYQRETPRKQ